MPEEDEADGYGPDAIEQRQAVRASVGVHDEIRWRAGSHRIESVTEGVIFQ
jgi:hypothetical protein